MTVRFRREQLKFKLNENHCSFWQSNKNDHLKVNHVILYTSDFCVIIHFVDLCFFFLGIAFIFYFLSYWFCKPTIQEEEEKSRHQQLSNNEELVENDDNDNPTFESTI